MVILFVTIVPTVFLSNLQLRFASVITIMDDKFCLKWNEYDTNIRESFKKLRQDQRFFDVTLATEDGQQIQANKLILSAGSQFFNDIFVNSEHTNVLVYLKGIRSEHLEHVTDFIYNGEAFITQEELVQFLETGRELKVKGLMGELQGVKENVQEGENAHKFQRDNGNFEQTENREHILSSVTDLTENFETTEYNVAKIGLKSRKSYANEELNYQIEQIINFDEGLWRCKMCGKTTPGQKQIMQNHAETHIDGRAHDCQSCSKTFKTRQLLKMHIYGIHSELFSCDICGKSEMNRHSYLQHKRKNHGSVLLQ